jgi:uncharacterized protein
MGAEMAKHSSQIQSQTPAPVSRRRLLASAAILAGAAVSGAKPASAETPSGIGEIWWTELQTRDPARTQAFYAKVMGWNPKVVAQADQTRAPQPGEKEYTLFTVGEQDTAGAVQVEGAPAETQTAGWLAYFQVTDVDTAIRDALALGGKLLEAPADMPNAGRIAVIEDWEGVRVGLFSATASSSG